MDNAILKSLLDALCGIAATAIIFKFQNQIAELYKRTFYGKLLDEHRFRKASGMDFYYTVMHKLDKAVPLENISFVTKDDKYKMHEHIPNSEIYEKISKIFNFYTRDCKRRGIPLFNGKVARLNNFRINDSKIVIETQELEYFDYVRSHLLADANFKNFYHIGNKNGYKSFRHFIGSRPELYLKLARTLGINILVVTKDSKIILQKRSNKTNIYRGTIYPSASGSLEYKDSIVLSFSSSSIKRIILGKELFEEVAIFPTQILDLALVGIYEDNYRLRLPDMFFIAALDSDFYDVREKYEKGHSKDSFETDGIIGISIDEFLSYDVKALSQPLKVYHKEKDILLEYLKEKGLY